MAYRYHKDQGRDAVGQSVDEYMPRCMYAHSLHGVRGATEVGDGLTNEFETLGTCLAACTPHSLHGEAPAFDP